jgi:hypothetical protein
MNTPALSLTGLAFFLSEAVFQALFGQADEPIGGVDQGIGSAGEESGVLDLFSRPLDFFEHVRKIAIAADENRRVVTVAKSACQHVGRYQDIDALFQREPLGVVQGSMLDADVGNVPETVKKPLMSFRRLRFPCGIERGRVVVPRFTLTFSPTAGNLVTPDSGPRR